MGFKVTTNIAALNAHTNSQYNNVKMDNSLEKLSSGLRINSAADDASGMSIANSLRNQANTLGQSIKNANDGIAIIQIADKAMTEQVKILDTIKVKATQAAQDGQNLDSRKALQSDIARLMEELDNVANTTSYNGLNLLSGQFTNKKFQIGSYNNQTISASIGATNSDKIGNTRFETSTNISASTNESLVFTVGNSKFTLESVTISSSAGTGVGALAETINKNSDMLGGVQASYDVVTTGSSAISAGDVTNLSINNVSIGDVTGVKANDSSGVLVDAINNFTGDTGVVASVDSRGHLELTSNDGRGIEISTDSSAQTANLTLNVSNHSFASSPVSNGTITEGFTLSVNGNSYTTDQDYTTTNDGNNESSFDKWLNNTIPELSDAQAVDLTGSYFVLKFDNAYNDVSIKANGTELQDILGVDEGNNINSSATITSTTSSGILNIETGDMKNFGRLSLTRVGASDIQVSGSGSSTTGLNNNLNKMEASINLRDIKESLTTDQASAMGLNANANVVGVSGAGTTGKVSGGVTTLRGAQAVITVADSSLKRLDQIRSDLGSTQNALQATVNNISVTQVNVSAAESQIRDVDFASESANFSKLNILSQSGSYAMSQANAIQQNVLRLLQ